MGYMGGKIGTGEWTTQVPVPIKEGNTRNGLYEGMVRRMGS